NGQAAGRDDQSGSPKLPAFRLDREVRPPAYRLDALVQEERDLRCAAFGFEQSGNLLRGTVAEELTEGLFVVRDPVLFDQGDEVRRAEPGQGRFGEVGICRKEVPGSAVNVGEVAAAAARDQDLLSRPVGALEQGHAAAPLSGLGRAEKAGGSRAK